MFAVLFSILGCSSWDKSLSLELNFNSQLRFLEEVGTFTMTTAITVTEFCFVLFSKKKKKKSFYLGESPHYFLFHQQVGTKSYPNSVTLQKGMIAVTDGGHQRSTGYSYLCGCDGP